MSNRPRFHTSTPLLAVFACLLWSTAFVGVKYGLRYASPLGFAGIRFMVSGLMILPFAIPSMRYHFRQRHFFQRAFLIGFFQTFLLYGLFYIGMTMIPGALGAIIVGSSPLIAALTAHFMLHDDRMTFKKTVSIAIGIAGIVLISLSRQPWTQTGMKELIGIILIIVGTICSAFGNILVSKDRENFNPLLLNAVQISFGGFCLTLVSLPVEGFPRWPVTLPFVFAFGWLAFLSAAAFSVWFVLLKRPGVKVSELNVWKFIIPVFGAIFSWILLTGESPELLSIAGMILVSFSVLFFHIRRPGDLKRSHGS